MTSRSEIEILSRSEGLVLAPFGTETAIYDLMTDRVIIVDQVAGWLLQVGGEPIERLVADAAEVTGIEPARIEADMRDGIATLADAGLLNRTDRWLPPVAFAGRPLADDGRPIGATQAMLDQQLAFRSSDGALLREVEEHLGLTDTDRSPTLTFDVEPTPEGGVVLDAADEWRFPNRSSFFVQLPGVINDFASHSHAMFVLHAGAAFTSDGRLLVLPGLPEAGKSTLPQRSSKRAATTSETNCSACSQPRSKRSVTREPWHSMPRAGRCSESATPACSFPTWLPTLSAAE